MAHGIITADLMNAALWLGAAFVGACVVYTESATRHFAAKAQPVMKT